MRSFKTHSHLEDLAASPAASRLGCGGSHRNHRWSQGVLRGYLVTCAGVLLLGLLAGRVGTLLGHPSRAQERRQLLESAHLLGPVLSHRERVKLSFLNRSVEEKFPNLSQSERAGLTETLYVSGRGHGVDPLLALSVIAQESNYEREAESSVGALGLMQVRPFVGKEIANQLGIVWQGRATLTDPSLNARIGIAYLAQMKQRYQHTALALAAYNLGPYRLQGLLSRGESLPNSYPERVLSFYQAYQRSYLAALNEVDAPSTAGSGTLAMAVESGESEGI